MKSEEAQKLVASAVDRLAQALERGQSEDLRAFLAAAARFHTYSFRNVLLIASQCPEATRVAGFHTWKSLGRYVKKGEKGIAIIAPIVFKRDTETQPNDDARSTDSTQLRFRAAYVFDVSQTDGEPLPELAETAGDPGVHAERLKTLIENRGIALTYAADLDGAEGLSKKGEIVIRSGQTPAAEFSVLVHELAHEILHQGPDRPTTKTVRELEAEAVAFTVCTAVGLEATTAASDYIQLYSGDKNLLAQSLDAIQKTAALILQAIEG